MATGKTHPRFFRFIVDEVDLSGDSRQFSSAGVQYEETQIQGWSDWGAYYNLGRVMHHFNGYQAVFNNTASTGSYTELSAKEEYLISLAMGIRAAPAVGDPAFLSAFEQTKIHVVGDGPVLVEADFAKSLTGLSNEKAFGVVLAAGASLEDTTNGTSVDNGASSSNGAVAHLHISVSSGGTWTFKVQDSPNDSVWADLITFSSNGSAVAAERGTASGTVDQYLRFQATRTSGTVTAWCTIARQ